MNGLVKSNISSQDNTLKYPDPSYYAINNNLNNSSNNQQQQSTTQNYNENADPQNRSYFPSFNQKPPSRQSQDIYNNTGNYHYTPRNNQMNQEIGFDSAPRQQAAKDSELRVDVENLNKQVYRKALDAQVAEKQANKYMEEKERKQNELELIPQYPFGKRTNPSYMLNDQNQQNNYQYTPTSYTPSFHDLSNERFYKLDKDRIYEKPNSLNDDVPPYDPVKEVKQYPNGPKRYDPWGKPGGGAPMIDPSTGKKYTRIAGQLHYDAIGLTPSARRKLDEENTYRRQLAIDEQKREMEFEQMRRKHSEEMHKARAGDVATWIQDIEGARWPLKTHLNHTNVTRDKVNLEHARHMANQRSKVYHDELGLQLEERERMNKLQKLKEDIAGIEHTRNWNDWVNIKLKIRYLLFDFNFFNL